MKKFLAVVVLSLAAFVALAFRKEVRAFPGMMCFNGSGCGKCEVCVKEKPYDASGTCKVIQGCY
jgi:hypothetical protein